MTDNLVDAVASELYRVFGSNDHLDERGRMQPFNCLWPYDKDMWRKYGQEVIAAIEPEMRKRHRAEVLEELRIIFTLDQSADWGVDDLLAILTEEAIREVKAVFSRQEAETDE